MAFRGGSASCSAFRDDISPETSMSSGRSSGGLGGMDSAILEAAAWQSARSRPIESWRLCSPLTVPETCRSVPRRVLSLDSHSRRRDTEAPAVSITCCSFWRRPSTVRCLSPTSVPMRSSFETVSFRSRISEGLLAGPLGGPPDKPL